ncbi:MAG: MBL fold metallo-hydrolase, partial [Clostridiales bacterium]|nr:MBL fold metallo-hydrolase [Clostridiales bacterium]
MATITTLIEDSGTEHLSLQIEHGLSFFIETEESSFIFDCGATDKFIINAARLDIDLGRAELVVCSHSHYDHAGGYPDLIKKFEIKRFITGNSFFEPKFACENEKYTYLGSGFGPWLLKKHNINHEICGDLIQISNDCWIVGNFKRIHDIETIPARFVRQKGNEFINDDFP